MPIYEYACAACGHEFEEWQKMSDPPVRTCPKCKKKKVERLISQTAFQLKGGGWYRDLYSSSKPAGQDGGAGKEGAAASAEAKGDKADKGDKGKEPGTKKESSSSAGGESKSSGEKKATTKKAESRAA